MAYASLVSLTQTIQEILHSDQTRVLHEEQQIRSLHEKVNFFISFLDAPSQKNSETIRLLEGRIRGAVYEAEDIIDSHLSHCIISESGSRGILWCFGQIINFMLRNVIPVFPKPERWMEFKHHNLEQKTEDLQKIIEDLDSISEEVLKMEDRNDIEDLPPTNSLRAGSSESGSGNKSTMVGFENEFIQIKDRLTLPPNKLEVISIVGMGGIGKTTLARNLYDDSLIVYHFDTRAWITVSHPYNVQKMLTGLLSYTRRLSRESDQDINELAEDLYKSLKGRRYLIVMDDVWDIQAWDQVKRFFPDDKNGSRIILTTRILDVAAYANPVSPIHHLNFLNLEQSWNLLCQTAFREEGCPSELEAIGKTIAENCKGLPLTLVVIGGLLCNAERTQDYWMYIAENLKSAVTKNDDQCMEILSLSYKLLPHHLRACFLYMGVFPEDDEIIVSHLIKLWVSEGFLKQIAHKSLEELAKEYLQDLVNRNMILVSEQNHNGQIKTCSIHDLMRELCLKIAREEKFLAVTKLHAMIFPEGTINHSGRHLSIHSGVVDHFANEHDSRARSLLYFCYRLADRLSSFTTSFRLLRVFDALTVSFLDFPVEIIELVNLRYIALIYTSKRMIPASISKLHKLQTLIVFPRHFSKVSYYLPPEIWKVPQLRHLLLHRCILPYPSGALNGGKVIRLESLQTLSEVSNLRFTEEVLQMIRNVKKLGISYLYDSQTIWSSYCFENLVHLHQLENLKCLILEMSQADYWSPLVNLAFPPTLKKLTLSGCKLHWGDMTIVGSLPNLEVLKLKEQAFEGPVWETNEGEFRRLKFLLIETTDLQTWITDETHFPRLQHLSLRFCSQLLEIPSEIGFIPTLQVIGLYECHPSAVTSGKLIQEEQEDLGNEVLQVRVYSREDEYQHYQSNSLRKRHGIISEDMLFRMVKRTHELMEIDSECEDQLQGNPTLLFGTHAPERSPSLTE